MTSPARWGARLVAILLLLAAALVVVGVALESGQGHVNSGTESSEHSEAGEGTEAHEVGEGEPGLEGASVAGILLESPLVVGGLAAASIVLAVAVWVRPGRATATLVILFSLAAGAFDVSEIAHQVGENSAGLLTIAVIVVVVRVVTIVGAVIVFRGRSARTPGAPG